MTMHAGDTTKKDVDCICSDCDTMMHIDQGQEIPECPCGGTDFEEVEKAGVGSKKSSKSSRSSTDWDDTEE
ncbi:MAG: alpha helical protein [Planctomycetaceae bacterium]|nr:zinc ribbon-containing protein [Planctomycetaceae bacterium]